MKLLGMECPEGSVAMTMDTQARFLERDDAYRKNLFQHALEGCPVILLGASENEPDLIIKLHPKRGV